MMNGKYIINHVMSRETESGIFSSILDYYKKYSPLWIEHVESIRPIEGADFYHYHRPQLESALVKNAFCTVHHDLNDTDPWHSRHHFIPRYNEAAAVICLNETQKQILSIEEDLPIGKLFVVPHGYNHELLSLKAPRSGNGEKFTLGIASRRYGRRVKGEAYASMEATCRSLAAELPTWKDSIEENLKVYGQIAGFDLKNPPTIVTASVFDTAEPQA
jgi:hypothetical protein